MSIQKRVILCAGHGGGDPGAIGQGTTEANEVIDITNRTVELLRKDGQIEVVHVPNELNFEQGIAWVNSKFKDMNDGLSIEVHKNSAGVPAHGVEVWYYGGDTDSDTLARKLQDKLKTILPDRGAQPDTSNRWGQLGWMRNVNTWSLLVEMGFVSDGGDPVGPSANAKYAKALAQGVLNVFGLNLKEEDSMDENAVKRAFMAVEHKQANAQDIRSWVGQPYDKYLDEAMRGSNWLTQNHYITYFVQTDKAVRDQQKTIDELKSQIGTEVNRKELEAAYEVLRKVLGKGQ